MIVVVCLCENNGMLFNKRRQSRDKLLIEDLSNVCGGALFISDFSASLFENSDISCIEASNPLEAADIGDYVFVENMHLSGYEKKIEGMIIYKWNRRYPADFFLDVLPADLDLNLKESSDFAGNSHEKITKEIYTR